MSPTEYIAQTAAAEKRLKLAREAGNTASMLAAIDTIKGLVEEFYGSATVPAGNQSGSLPQKHQAS
jgi:hypothetical protein